MESLDTRPVLIAVDWGTTNLRLYLISKQLQCIAEISSDEGLLNLKHGFQKTLEKRINPWLASNGALPIVIIGMAGSRDGWIDVPYLHCPATLVDLAQGVRKVSLSNNTNAVIIPGLSGTSRSNSIDIMRGEETQIFGALALKETIQPCLFCLPGTHTKWATAVEDSITSFSTTMTGEVFNLLCKHSLLATSIDRDASFDKESFYAGLATSKKPGGLLHHLFSVRTHSIFASNNARQGASCLSGIIIGHDILSMTDGTEENIVIIGSEKLSALYCQAFDFFNIPCSRIDAKEATIAGCYAITTMTATMTTTITGLINTETSV